ncbi:MAG TPA: SAM-dependent methyltransferase [Longimicrobium sp.]|jgi:precorrin-6B methylase 1
MSGNFNGRTPAPHGFRRGGLVVVGSGIKAIGHFTLEAVAHIQAADSVFYHVADGVTARHIVELNASAVDLNRYYGEDKLRRVTYIQMAEVILREVRRGKYVVAVFYGHPGFFVFPARRALAVAELEGYDTAMLPGISSTDFLFAELRIDPSQSGCQIVEASDLLLRNRPLLTGSHVLVLQVGAVGDPGYSVLRFKNAKPAVLFDRLIEEYGEDHPSALYVATSFPGARSAIQWRRLVEYRGPQADRLVLPLSTLYLPPRDLAETDPEMADRLGVGRLRGTTRPGPHSAVAAYGDFEREAVAALVDPRTPSRTPTKRSSRALWRAMSDLALNPRAAEAFRLNAHAFVRMHPDLSPAECGALLLGYASVLHNATRVEPASADPGPATGPRETHLFGAVALLHASAERPAELEELVTEMERRFESPGGEAAVDQWLLTRGHNTTMAALERTLQELGSSLGLFAGRYPMLVDSRPAGTLTIERDPATDEVSVRMWHAGGSSVERNVPNWSYDPETRTLRWGETGDGNGHATGWGELKFGVALGAEPDALETGYIGPYFGGRYWRGDDRPSAPNAYGKLNVATASAMSVPAAVDAPEVWEGSYQCYYYDGPPGEGDDSPTYPGPRVVVAVDGTGLAATIDEIPVALPMFAANRLWWSAGEGHNETAASLAFVLAPTVPGAPSARVFFGRLWAGAVRPPAYVNVLGVGAGAPMVFPSRLELLRLATRHGVLTGLADALLPFVALGRAAWRDPREAADADWQRMARRLRGMLSHVEASAHATPFPALIPPIRRTTVAP